MATETSSPLAKATAVPGSSQAAIDEILTGSGDLPADTLRETLRLFYDTILAQGDRMRILEAKLKDAEALPFEISDIRDKLELLVEVKANRTETKAISDTVSSVLDTVAAKSSIDYVNARVNDEAEGILHQMETEINQLREDARGYHQELAKVSRDVSDLSSVTSRKVDESRLQSLEHDLSSERRHNLERLALANDDHGRQLAELSSTQASLRRDVDNFAAKFTTKVDRELLSSVEGRLESQLLQAKSDVQSLQHAVNQKATMSDVTTTLETLVPQLGLDRSRDTKQEEVEIIVSRRVDQVHKNIMTVESGLESSINSLQTDLSVLQSNYESTVRDIVASLERKSNRSECEEHARRAAALAVPVVHNSNNSEEVQELKRDIDAVVDALCGSSTSAISGNTTVIATSPLDASRMSSSRRAGGRVHAIVETLDAKADRQDLSRLHDQLADVRTLVQEWMADSEVRSKALLSSLQVNGGGEDGGSVDTAALERLMADFQFWNSQLERKAGRDEVLRLKSSVSSLRAEFQEISGEVARKADTTRVNHQLDSKASSDEASRILTQVQNAEKRLTQGLQDMTTHEEIDTLRRELNKVTRVVMEQHQPGASGGAGGSGGIAAGGSEPNVNLFLDTKADKVDIDAIRRDIDSLRSRAQDDLHVQIAEVVKASSDSMGGALRSKVDRDEFDDLVNRLRTDFNELSRTVHNQHEEWMLNLDEKATHTEVLKIQHGFKQLSRDVANFEDLVHSVPSRTDFANLRTDLEQRVDNEEVQDMKRALAILQTTMNDTLHTLDGPSVIDSTLGDANRSFSSQVGSVSGGAGGNLFEKKATQGRVDELARLVDELRSDVETVAASADSASSQFHHLSKSHFESTRLVMEVQGEIASLKESQAKSLTRDDVKNIGRDGVNDGDVKRVVNSVVDDAERRITNKIANTTDGLERRLLDCVPREEVLSLKTSLNKLRGEVEAGNAELNRVVQSKATESEIVRATENLAKQHELTTLQQQVNALESKTGRVDSVIKDALAEHPSRTEVKEIFSGIRGDLATYQESTLSREEVSHAMSVAIAELQVEINSFVRQSLESRDAALTDILNPLATKEDVAALRATVSAFAEKDDNREVKTAATLVDLAERDSKIETMIKAVEAAIAKKADADDVAAALDVKTDTKHLNDWIADFAKDINTALDSKVSEETVNAFRDEVLEMGRGNAAIQARLDEIVRSAAKATVVEDLARIVATKVSQDEIVDYVKGKANISDMRTFLDRSYENFDRALGTKADARQLAEVIEALQHRPDRKMVEQICHAYIHSLRADTSILQNGVKELLARRVATRTHASPPPPAPIVSATPQNGISQALSEFRADINNRRVAASRTASALEQSVAAKTPVGARDIAARIQDDV